MSEKVVSNFCYCPAAGEYKHPSVVQEFGPPPGKMSIDERRAHLAQVKQEYERSLTEFDSKIMEQVNTGFS